jgi:hypothetical protein
MSAAFYAVVLILPDSSENGVLPDKNGETADYRRGSVFFPGISRIGNYVLNARQLTSSQDAMGLQQAFSSLH